MRKTILLAILFSSVCVNFSKAQNEKFKALFMYNFTKHILWPENYREGNFIIYVYGTSSITNELRVIAQKKNVNGQPIVIRKITSVSQIEKCHIVYIPRYNGSKLHVVHNILKTKPTVIITDDYGLAKQGAAINYVTREDGQNYEIYRNNIVINGLKVSPMLFKLGIEK